MSTLQLKSQLASSDTSLPVLQLDSVLNVGSLFLLDFARVSCWDPASDTVANNAVVRNMVSGAANGVLKVPGAGDLTFVSGKGFQLSATAALGRVEIGAGTDFFQSNLTDDFVITAWVTYPVSAPAHDTGFIITKNAAAGYSGEGPLLASRYYAGGGVWGCLDGGGSSRGVDNGVSPAGKHQFAIAKEGANQKYYRDKVLVYTLALGVNPLTANNTPLCFGNGAAAGQYASEGLILHRVYGEDLTVSGRTAASVIAADYAINASRF